MLRNRTKLKSWINEYKKEYNKKARRENTPYAQRQRRHRSEYYKTPQGKALAKASRKRNIKNILLSNRKRQLLKKNVFGTHSEKEWEQLKQSYNYCCAKCGISEKELRVKWNKTSFDKLTKDHIWPISKGGSDYINNIQPLCISCNAKKIDKLDKSKIIVATCGFFDPLHIGHVELFTKSKLLGDFLLVMVNSDEAAIKKKGYCFMPLKERMAIIATIDSVDAVVPVIDKDGTSCKTLEKYKPNILTKGGDRYASEIPEAEICRKCNIKIIDGVGAKIQSSSELVKKAEASKCCQ